MAERRRDAVDHHVARWSDHWHDNPAFNPEVEGAITRMQTLLQRLKRLDAAAFVGSEISIEDYQTLHSLMVMPYPGEATPAQLADATRVTRAAMTSRLDRLVDAGLITRVTDEVDRRRVVVRPTPAGRDAWEHLVHEGMRREQTILAALSPAQLEQLNALLRTVLISLDEKG
jgi:DNA-binding MarR family transcriptional regulator